MTLAQWIIVVAGVLAFAVCLYSLCCAAGLGERVRGKK